MNEVDPKLLGRLMRRQASLGLTVAAVFVLLLVGLPLANLYLPDLMAQKVLGFPLTWLILAILFYPITWVLSVYFVKRTEEIEAQEREEVLQALSKEKAR